MTESLCPDCINFAKTDFKEVMDASGVFERTSMHSLAWGNAYSETKQVCPSPTPGKYNSSVLKCWMTNCLSTAKPEVFEDCFGGDFSTKVTCQHGRDEDIGNVPPGIVPIEDLPMRFTDPPMSGRSSPARNRASRRFVPQTRFTSQTSLESYRTEAPDDSAEHEELLPLDSSSSLSQPPANKRLRDRYP